MLEQLPSKRCALKEMSVNTSTSMPSIVGYYSRKPTEPSIKVQPPRHKCSSSEETKLRRFFKCTKFNLKTGLKSGLQCFACKNDETVFDRHLKTRHKNETFFCCYCYPKVNSSSQEIKPEDYMDGQKLIKHMTTAHKYRRFQCNLCLYRSISAEHVNIHQKNIHPDIYKASLQNKMFDRKFCRIIECPPPARNVYTKLQPALQHYNTHRYPRINNGETNADEYQCLYCDFMDESLSEVIHHCVHTHPDYHILYYNPDSELPEVTSSNPPQLIHQLNDFDMFSSTNDETQDNRVSSTDAPKDWDKNKAYVEQMAFKKKDRVSVVQSRDQLLNAGMSSTSLNKDRLYQYNRKPCPASKIRNLATAVNKMAGKSRLNQPVRQNGQNVTHLRKEQERIRQSVNEKKRTYESEDSDNEQNKPPPKKVAKINQQFPNKSKYIADQSRSTSMSNQSRPTIPTKSFYDNQSSKSAGLPPLISPTKKPKRHMVCQMCEGNMKFLTEDGVKAHLRTFHKKLNCLKPNPFLCGYCKKFADSETDYKITLHQKTCHKRPEGFGELIEKLFISRAEYDRKEMKRNREKAMKNRMEQEKKKDKGDSNQKQRRKSGLNYLSEDEEEEVVESTYGLSHRNANMAKKKDSEKRKFSQLKKIRDEKNLNRKKDETPRKISNKSRYKSTDSEMSCKSSPIIQFDSDDERRSPSPKPSTSKTVNSKTTIDRATPERDSSGSDELPLYICFFCDETFTEHKRAIPHMDSHIPELDDPAEIKSVNNWVKRFLKETLFGKLFLKSEDYQTDDPHYRCPICVKIGSAKSVAPKRFKHLYEAIAHLWEHSYWKPMKCMTDMGDEERSNCNTKLANNDHLIAKHLNHCHHDALNQSENIFIRALVGNQAKDGFPEHTRDALVEEEYLAEEASRGQVIEKHIHYLIETMIEERESQLRAHAERQFRLDTDTDISVSLPVIRVQRLPALNFEDSHMIYQYLMDVEVAASQSSKANESRIVIKAKPRASRTQTRVETLDIASSDDEEIIPLPKKKSPVIIDEEDEEEILKYDNDQDNDVLDDDIDEDVLLSEDNDPIRRESKDKRVSPDVKPKTTSPSKSSVSNTGNSQRSGKYRCKYCENMFDNNRNAKHHVMQSHPDNPIVFERVCDDD